jgi:hypothetical protein
MLKVVMEAAGEPLGVLPLVLIPVAALALVATIFLLRYKRKGDK